MKVSKLFHWLYASVMLLPIFAIGFKCLYVTFNPNAKDSYFNTTINERTLTDVNNVNNQDLYNFYAVRSGNFTANNNLRVYITDFKDNSNLGITFNVDSFLFYVDSSNNSIIVNFYDITNAVIVKQTTATTINFDFRYISQTGAMTQENFLRYVKQVEFNPTSFIDNAFYYSVNQINEMRLFNWAKDSFIVAPYRYIGNLFGLQQDSPIYTMLSYWTNISVIWLVFDLIMYVPLLAHRWLDKGGIE